MADRICADCISEPYLQGIIRASHERSHECDFCEELKPTIEMCELASRCDKVIETFFELSSQRRAAAIYGYTPAGMQVPQLLERLLGGTEGMRDELVGMLGDLWFDRDSMETRYGDDDDPWFVEKTDYPESLSVAWRAMERQLRHEARLVNPAVAAVLEDIFGPLLNYQTHDGKPVVVEAGPGRELTTFFRARVFQTLDEVQQALGHPERYLGPPPEGTVAAGRMNCAGVAVFYGAQDKVTAICEVRPAVGSHVVVGEFKVVRQVRLLDLNALGATGLAAGGSLFDPAAQERASRGQFLKTLTAQMARPVVPQWEHRDYLTTQAIADFLATHRSLELDGIVFPSAQRARGEQGVPHRNVILFNKASTVVGAAPRPRPPYGVKLFEYEENVADFAPQIFGGGTETAAAGTEPSSWPPTTLGKPTLELNADTIEIHAIHAVEFATERHPVFHHRAHEIARQ